MGDDDYGPILRGLEAVRESDSERAEELLIAADLLEENGFEMPADVLRKLAALTESQVSAPVPKNGRSRHWGVQIEAADRAIREFREAVARAGFTPSAPVPAESHSSADGDHSAADPPQSPD